ncbi:hypothetical protein F4604DRAFT_1924349 [Suillus subluteus]|nr:hypothetical protein F4604DRAFT_1924349 [Suillus subluteus]
MQVDVCDAPPGVIALSFDDGPLPASNQLYQFLASHSEYEYVLPSTPGHHSRNYQNPRLQTETGSMFDTHGLIVQQFLAGSSIRLRWCNSLKFPAGLGPHCHHSTCLLPAMSRYSGADDPQSYNLNAQQAGQTHTTSSGYHAAYGELDDQPQQLAPSFSSSTTGAVSALYTHLPPVEMITDLDVGSAGGYHYNYLTGSNDQPEETLALSFTPSSCNPLSHVSSFLDVQARDRCEIYETGSGSQGLPASLDDSPAGYGGYQHTSGAGDRYDYLPGFSDQPEQEPLASSFTPPNQDLLSRSDFPDLHDAQVGDRRDLYQTSSGSQGLPASLDNPPAGYSGYQYTSGNTSSGDYNYFPNDQSEQQSLAPSFALPSQDLSSLSNFSGMLDVQAGDRHDPYQTSSESQGLPVSLDDPPASHSGYNYNSGNISSGEDPLASSQTSTLAYPNTNAQGDYHEDPPTTFPNVLSFCYTPFDPNVGTIFPNPHLDTHTSRGDNDSTGEAESTIRVESAPNTTPYAYMPSTSTHHYAFMASYFPDFCPPLQSADGVSTMPDSEDMMPLDIGQPLPLDEPSSSNAPGLGDPLPSRSSHSKKRRQGDHFILFDPSQKRMRGWAPAKGVLDVAPSMAPSQPLVAAGSGQPTSTLSNIGPVKYDESHPIHKGIIQMALDIVIHSVVNGNPFLSEEARKQQEPPFPPKYLYEMHELNPFENQVIRDVVQNTIIELGYGPYVTQLDGMYCTATVAVHCVMLGLKDGGNDNVEFSVKVFQPMHAKLMKYIEDHINTNKEQLDWWEHYKLLMQCRLASIHTFQSQLKA